MAESAARVDISMECSSAGWKKPVRSSTRPRGSSIAWSPRASRSRPPSDAHSLERVGERAGDLAEMLEARGVHELASYTQRERQMIPLRAELAATLAELAAPRTSLDEPVVDHLLRLTASWSLLADLSFSDMLLMASVDGCRTADDAGFVVLGQMRPNNRSTLINDDLVGTTHDATSGRSFELAFRERYADHRRAQRRARSTTSSRVVRARALRRRTSSRSWCASRVLCGVRPRSSSRPYLSVFERLCDMVADATFPVPRRRRRGPGTSARRRRDHLDRRVPVASSSRRRTP